MHDRQSVTSCRVTEPGGNPAKSSTPSGAFAFDAFDAFCVLAAFDASPIPAARAFGFDPAAPFFDPAAAAFFAADFFGAPPFFAFGGVGFAFFAAVFGLLLVAAIIAGG